MYLLMVITVYLVFAKFFVDWKRWREFYPTIQYYIICNLLYNFVFYNHTLWAYKSVTLKWLGHTIIDLSFTFIIVPVVFMLFLQYYPKGKKQLFYIAFWVGYFSIIELFFMKKGLFIYENGWNIYWSILFNFITFSMIKLHHKNTLVALIISLPIITILILFFHPSMHELK